MEGSESIGEKMNPPIPPIEVSKEGENPMSDDRKFFYLIAAGVVALMLLVFSFFAFNITTVKGTQMGVLESWSGGVEANAYPPKTYFLFPGWSQHLYKYDMDAQVFVMNDKSTSEEKAYKGRETDSYTVQSSEGQNMKIALNVRWRRDPAKIVQLHQNYPTHIEERLIRPTVMLLVKNRATQRKAIEAFSGEGLVKLQSDILRDLTDQGNELAHHGVIVENFVIEKIELDKEYIEEIRGRQVATQRKLRADEETKAAEAAALKAQAEARADYNKRVVEAERDKQVGILAAEQDKQTQILSAQAQAERVTLQAEAAKKQTVLAAEAEKDSGVLRAQAIEAIGKAEADANRLKFDAYNSPGAAVFAKIEMSRSMAGAYGNIKGYLPSNMNVTLLTDNFLQSVENLMNRGPAK